VVLSHPQTGSITVGQTHALGSPPGSQSALLHDVPKTVVIPTKSERKKDFISLIFGALRTNSKNIASSDA
jgi:hypothetical protein